MLYRTDWGKCAWRSVWNVWFQNNQSRGYVNLIHFIHGATIMHKTFVLLSEEVDQLKKKTVTQPKK